MLLVYEGILGEPPRLYSYMSATLRFYILFLVNNYLFPAYDTTQSPVVLPLSEEWLHNE